MTDTTEELRVAARSIALAGINGWGNLCEEAADTIDTLRDENKRLEADVKDQGVREELSIGKAINRAARDLPEGWGIRIDLERHAGVVFLTDPDGNETMSEGGELFSDQINAAIDAARAQAKEGGA